MSDPPVAPIVDATAGAFSTTGDCARSSGLAMWSPAGVVRPVQGAAPTSGRLGLGCGVRLAESLMSCAIFCW